MIYINLTPHDIYFYADDKLTLLHIFPKEKNIAIPRVDEECEKICILDDKFPLYKKRYKKIENMPSPKPNTYYIVSMLVLQNLTDRKDVICPDTGLGVVRDTNGAIKGTTRFQTNY